MKKKAMAIGAAILTLLMVLSFAPLTAHGLTEEAGPETSSAVQDALAATPSADEPGIPPGDSGESANNAAAPADEIHPQVDGENTAMGTEATPADNAQALEGETETLDSAQVLEEEPAEDKHELTEDEEDVSAAVAANAPISVFVSGVKFQGKVFNDLDLDGVLDARESFLTLSGISAVLTSPSGAILPQDVNILPDGTFTVAALGAGTYTLTITNANTDTSRTPAYGFTPTTSSRHSVIAMPPFGSTSWYMDIQQANIAADQSMAVYTFEIPENEVRPQGVGIALAGPVTVTFTAGIGVASHFGQATDPQALVLRSTALGSAVTPAIGGNVLPGYDADTLVWTLDKAVSLWDGTAVPAGAKITGEQLANVKATESFLATASLLMSRYDIRYDYTQGTAPLLPNPTGYTAEDVFPIAMPNEPTRSGHTFAGWTVNYENDALTDVTQAVKNYSVPAGTTGDIVLTAVWAANQYTVSYKGNAPNVTGTMQAQTATYNAELTLSKNAFVRSGYDFAGWNTKPDGTGTLYRDEELFAPWQLTKDLTLYAQWQAKETVPETFTVTFVDWDGRVLKTEKVPAGKDATAPTSPARTGYHFAGWSGNYTNVTSNVTVIARYTALPNNGTGENSEEPEPQPPAGGEAINEEPVGEDLLDVGTHPGFGPDNAPVPEDVLDTLHNEDAATVNIDDTEIPLATGSSPQYTWALMNLILSGIGVVLAVIAALHLLRKKQREANGEYVDTEQEPTVKKRHTVMSIASIVLGIAGIVLFFFTEDMRHAMVLVDNWTIVQAMILLVEILGLAVIFTRKKEKNTVDEETAA